MNCYSLYQFSQYLRRNGTADKGSNIPLEILRTTKIFFYFDIFHSRLTKVAWPADTWAEIQFEILELAQVWFQDDGTLNSEILNTLARYAYKNMANIQFPTLGLPSLRIIGYSDADYANNHGRASQLGRKVMLMDDKSNCGPISFKSFKSKRVRGIGFQASSKITSTSKRFKVCSK